MCYCFCGILRSLDIILKKGWTNPGLYNNTVLDSLNPLNTNSDEKCVLGVFRHILVIFLILKDMYDEN